MTQYKRRLTWSRKLDKWSDADEADGTCDRGRGFGCFVSEQYKDLNAGMAFRASNTGDLSLDSDRPPRILRYETCRAQTPKLCLSKRMVFANATV
jgi:hypothetical protein